MPSIAYGTRSIEFEVLRKARMKNTYIQVTSDGVLVKTNRTTSMREINGFVIKKSAWIVKHIENLKAKKVEESLVTGSRLYYLGKSYYVEIQEQEELKNAVLEFSHSRFVIKAQKGVSQEELAWVVNKFYKEKAIEKITPLVEKWSEEMCLRPAHVGYRKAKTRWGSCSGRDRISFNYYLLKMSTSCIEYVVVHELAHIRHKNHSADFWGLVKKYLDNYKVIEDKIRVFEKVI
jgi:predicted metal-dependent hydrolase